MSTYPVPQTSTAGHFGIELKTCIKCFRPARSFSMRDTHDWSAPREARGKWWECECGHEWPGWSKPIYFDSGAA